MVVAKAAEGVAATAQSPPQHFSSSKVALPHSRLIGGNWDTNSSKHENIKACD